MQRKFFRGVLLASLLVVVLNLFAEEAAKTAPAASTSASQDPLIRILVAKGVITADESRFISAGSNANQHEKLLMLLKDKGVLSTADLDSLNSQPAPVLQPAVLTANVAATPAKAAEIRPTPVVPKFVAAVAPVRVLPLEPAKKDGLIPDLKLGSGARLKLYGFLKMSTVHDSSSPYGNDFPLPGFIGSIDTGPNKGSEFHIKARASRIGANFDWPEVSPNLSLTGKVEFDFEGNFTRISNRNISSIRSSQPSIRLAYGRLDYKASDRTSYFALFGQDFTPFASSTLPNLLETTGYGIGFGTLYERDPQVRLGGQHNFGGPRAFTVAPEVAFVLPTAGNPPTTVNSATMFGAAFAGIDNQLGYGERQGADSGRPQLQARLAFQWQLDKAPGVAPAQLLFSVMDGSRAVLVPRSQFDSPPTTALTPGQAATLALVKAAFPTGTSVSSDQKGATVELQLPTRFVTLLAKYYNGEDLRYYFAGGLYSTFNSTAGLTNTITVASVDGSGVIFGTTADGKAVVAPQLPVRAQGGFVNLGFPLGRIMKADPASRAAGWQLYLHYGLDDPYARDVRHTGSISATSAGLRDRSDMAAATLYWKFNQFLTFGYEESYYRTRLSNGGTPNITTPTWDGGPVRSWQNVRSEFSTIFSF